MICPKCGNQVSPDESFCGQCGTPMTPTPPEQSSATVQTPMPRSGLLSSFKPPTGAYNAGSPPVEGYPTVQAPPTRNTFGSGQQTPRPAPPTPHQQTGLGNSQTSLGNSQTSFYQDATEAMSALPGTPGAGYSQPGFPAGTPVQGSYPGSGQYGTQVQPFQSGHYSGAGYPPGQTYLPGQVYGAPPLGPTPAPQPQRHNSMPLIIASVFLAIALVIAVVIGTLYFARGQNQTAVTPPSPTVAPTATLAPTPSPTTQPTPSPTQIPSPTVAPTPAPNPGFAWCDQTCTNNGFSMQYPAGWVRGTNAGGTLVHFTHPTDPETLANFKTPGPATQTADQLVNGDIQALNPHPTDMSPNTTTTIGGTTWTSAIAHYQPGTQVDRIQVYATVYQGKAYIIELQAPETTFNDMNNQFFVTMLGTFQFVQGTH
ncbi:MAG: zinc-ribbon domain-containing protein [Ktedonobacteraceae bacterium]|nr:zinc-ribbon domain-containing protein [Ktedonobacteraceae bacterium]